MVRVCAAELMVSFRDWARAFGGRTVLSMRRNELERLPNSFTKKLATYLKAQKLANGTGHGVSRLTMCRGSSTEDSIAIRERLQPC
jgi:hypothetical protein